MILIFSASSVHASATRLSDSIVCVRVLFTDFCSRRPTEIKWNFSYLIYFVPHSFVYFSLLLFSFEFHSYIAHTSSNKHRTIYSFHSTEWMKCLRAFVEHYWLMRDSLIEFISVVCRLNARRGTSSFICLSFIRAHSISDICVCVCRVNSRRPFSRRRVMNMVCSCANTANKSFHFTQWINGS